MIHENGKLIIAAFSASTLRIRLQAPLYFVQRQARKQQVATVATASNRTAPLSASTTRPPLHVHRVTTRKKIGD